MCESEWRLAPSKSPSDCIMTELHILLLNVSFARPTTRLLPWYNRIPLSEVVNNKLRVRGPEALKSGGEGGRFQKGLVGCSHAGPAVRTRTSQWSLRANSGFWLTIQILYCVLLCFARALRLGRSSLFRCSLSSLIISISLSFGQNCDPKVIVLTKILCLKLCNY